MCTNSEILKQVETLLEACKEQGITLVTAESCTGGLVSSALTEIAGSSEVVLVWICHLFK